jgi:hypothetical protein
LLNERSQAEKASALCFHLNDVWKSQNSNDGECIRGCLGLATGE